MELGRECLKLWGYDRIDELIWVKTNQLQRIIRTGRTGHWLNHGKEHCLVSGRPPPTRVPKQHVHTHPKPRNQEFIQGTWGKNSNCRFMAR